MNGTVTIHATSEGSVAQADGRAVDRDADAGALASRLLAGGWSSLCFEAGTHAVRSPVRLAAGAQIAGRGPATVLAAEASAVAILGEGVDGIAVRDLAIAGGAATQAGVRLIGCGMAVVVGLQVRGCAGVGIEVAENSFLAQVRDCHLLGNGRAGVLLRRLHRDGRCGDYVPSMVNGCTVAGGGAGIECERALVVTITGCQVFQTTRPAFHVHSTSNSVLISGCRSFQCEDDAVRVERSHEFNLTGNILCWQRGHGVVLRDVTWATVCGNNVIDSGGCQYRDPRCGIVVDDGSRGVVVAGNSVFNWGGQGPMVDGIVARAGASEIHVANNHVNFATGRLAAVEGPASTLTGLSGVADPAYLGRPDQPDREFVRDPLAAAIAGLTRR